MKRTTDRVTRKNRLRSARAARLARLAIIYLRQGIGGNVSEASTSRRCAEDAHTWALQLGWNSERIHVIADHGGPSGSRPGYAELLDRIRSDDVGVLLVSDLSRIGRDARSVAEFIALLIERNVLLVVNGRVVSRDAALNVLCGGWR